MSIRVSTQSNVTTITLDRTEKKNALTAAMYAALTDALVAANRDEEVRAVVITGAGGTFTAGNDMKDFLDTSRNAKSPPALSFMHALMDCEKPVVAAVNGTAIGIGVTMLLHCDLVYLAEDAKLVMPFVNLGLVPEFGSSVILPRLIGHARAAEKLMLGEPIRAREAVEMGIANAVLPAADVLKHATQIAAQFCTLPPAAVRETKKLMKAGVARNLRDTINVEFDVFGSQLRGPEAHEAIEAFLQKRKADFSRFR